jgi:hypothetical protein
METPMSTETAVPSKPTRLLLVKILIGMLLLVGAFAAYIANQPDEYQIERSTTIAVANADVFERVNDFHKWDAWSPWAKLDPNAKNTFDGPEFGPGAKFHWSGNSQVGEGSMKIQATEGVNHIIIQLKLEKPMKDQSIVVFDFEPQGDQTIVRWLIRGHYNDFISKAMCTVVNKNKQIGAMLEEGLTNLKKSVETQIADRIESP